MKTRIFFLFGFLYFLSLSAAFADTQMEIVFDASRSMNENMGQNSRLVEAKKALTEIVGQIEPGTLVGLRVFGLTPVQGNVRDSCFDSKLLIPIQPFAKQAMLDEVNGLAANGQTPLGYSLELAGQDFAPDPAVKKTMILISDGEESCGKDPINVIGSLKARGINFVVHAIGLAVDPKTQAQLKQITQMTGGTYKNVQNAAELKDQLQTVAEKENIVEAPGEKTAASMEAPAPVKEEPPAPKTPEEKLLTAGREGTGENVLAATAGAKIISASNELLAQAIDGSDANGDLMEEGDAAVIAFKDNHVLLLEKFAIPIAEENDDNPGELALSGSLEGPETGFVPITKIHPKNKVDFKNINQEFRIDPPVPVRFLKVRVGQAVKGSGSSFQPEWKAYGKFLSDAELADALKNQKPRERNLLAKEAGGRLISSSDPSFSALIDGNDKGDTAVLEAGQEAVFGFAGDKTAVLSSVGVPVFGTSDTNCRTLNFFVSETGPEEFTAVGSLKTQNMAVGDDPYQEFKFASPVKAKYLKMQMVDGHNGDSCELSELRANGIFADEASAVPIQAVPAIPAPAVPAEENSPPPPAAS